MSLTSHMTRIKNDYDSLYVLMTRKLESMEINGAPESEILRMRSEITTLESFIKKHLVYNSSLMSVCQLGDKFKDIPTQNSCTRKASGDCWYYQEKNECEPNCIKYKL